MSRPFLLVQLSDPHIGATWGGGDPVAGLAATVEAVAALRAQPDAVLISGDLADTPTEGEYEQVRELLAPLRAPLYVLPGNHDDRALLRRHFGLPGAGADPVQYAADLGALRLVVIDTTRPGEDPGGLDAERLAWLDGELAAAPGSPTLLAMHHPPLRTGLAAFDDYALASDDRQALAEVLRRHPQVKRIAAGHVHCPMTAELAGRPVVTAPSTYVQMRMDFGAEEPELSAGPGGILMHAVVDGDLLSPVCTQTR